MQVSIIKTMELIEKINFFDGFTDLDKKTLAQIATFHSYEPGTSIIEQNSLVLKLLFQINGKVDIKIDGAKVTSFKGGGNVYGEMSFVHHTPASASVVANTKVVMMEFDTEKLNAMVEPIYYRLRMDIYRSCAEVLAKKLIATNAIAKSYIHQEKSAELILIED